MGQACHTVAVTGACNFLGTELLRGLEVDRRYRRVLAVDVRRPRTPLEKTEFIRLDLTLPSADAELADLFAHEGVTHVVHGAFLSHPTHATSWAHELEDIGTMHLLNACAVTDPQLVVLVSTTMVYGASAENPNFLTEAKPLPQAARAQFVDDKLQAARQCEQFAIDHPGTRVCALRFAPLLGPSVDNFFTQFFSRPVAPVMMGYDPLMQFVHESDAATALKLALDQAPHGAFNIVGTGVLPYTTVLALMGKLPLPLPRFVAYPLSQALWATQIFESPPAFLDYLRFLCVASGRKARDELGFAPRYDIKRTILDFLGVAEIDGAADIASVQG